MKERERKGNEMQQEIIHTFAVCAYKDSPYLEECLRSVTSQTVKSEVICCTSTPSSYIRELTARYQVPLYVRDGASNIREDWMFAYGKAQGRFVTIAHQDDRYVRLPFIGGLPSRRGVNWFLRLLRVSYTSMRIR